MISHRQRTYDMQQNVGNTTLLNAIMQLFDSFLYFSSVIIFILLFAFSNFCSFRSHDNFFPLHIAGHTESLLFQWHIRLFFLVFYPFHFKIHQSEMWAVTLLFFDAVDRNIEWMQPLIEWVGGCDFCSQKIVTNSCIFRLYLSIFENVVVDIHLVMHFHN